MYNENTPSTHNATESNGGSNVDTDASASTKFSKDDQTPGTWKCFTYSK